MTQFSPRFPFWIGSLGVGLAIFCSIGWIGSEKFLVPPRRALEPRHQSVLENPAAFGLELGETFSVTAPDGVELKARLISPAANPGEAVKTRRMRERLNVPHDVSATVVMLHGRGGIKEDAFPVAERFVAAGFACLVFDARAHGVSGGEFTTYGAREVEDLRAVINAAEDHYGKETLGSLVGFGISLGAAVLLQALPEESRLEAAVLVSPFAELETVIHRAVENVVDSRMPALLPGLVMKFGGLRGGFAPSKIRPVDQAKTIGVPIMIVHAEDDRVIPPLQSRRVLDALPAREQAHRWRSVEDANHGNVLARGGDDLYQEMIEFWLKSVDT